MMKAIGNAGNAMARKSRPSSRSSATRRCFVAAGHGLPASVSGGSRTNWCGAAEDVGLDGRGKRQFRTEDVHRPVAALDASRKAANAGHWVRASRTICRPGDRDQRFPAAASPLDPQRFRRSRQASGRYRRLPVMKV